MKFQDKKICRNHSGLLDSITFSMHWTQLRVAGYHKWSLFFIRIILDVFYMFASFSFLFYIFNFKFYWHCNFLNLRNASLSSYLKMDKLNKVIQVGKIKNGITCTDVDIFCLREFRNLFAFIILNINWKNNDLHL